MRGLTAFDRRLSAHSPAPLAVAFSGGGDSLALLLTAKAWADAHGRRVVALTVDHGLRPESALWTQQCRETADRLGVGFEGLQWTAEKPASGLPAAARAARHALLADAARVAGARVLLMGHTADDLLEAKAMRAEGSTVPDPREWSPSPAWPKGRGVFILRPLLKQRRAELRDWLADQGESWIDDPANEDLRFARARARTLNPAHPGERRDPSRLSVGPGVRRDERWREIAGLLETNRSMMSVAEVAAACLCAAGTIRPPRGDRLARLTDRLNGSEAFTATLAGARIEADSSAVRFLRDAGETARGGLAPIRLSPHEPQVWDGRFELAADRPLQARALKGLAGRLPEAERRALAVVPAAARPGLPAVVDIAGVVHCPLLSGASNVTVRALALERFRAAMGFIDREDDL